MNFRLKPNPLNRIHQITLQEGSQSGLHITELVAPPSPEAPPDVVEEKDFEVIAGATPDADEKDFSGKGPGDGAQNLTAFTSIANQVKQLLTHNRNVSRFDAQLETIAKKFQTFVNNWDPYTSPITDGGYAQVLLDTLTDLLVELKKDAGVTYREQIAEIDRVFLAARNFRWKK